MCPYLNLKDSWRFLDFFFKKYPLGKKKKVPFGVRTKQDSWHAQPQALNGSATYLSLPAWKENTISSTKG